MSRTPAWVRVASCEDIPLREGRVVMIGDREIAVFNLGEKFLAVENRCPHRQGPLADGILAGATVICPLHAWKVNLEDGRVEKPAETAACVERFRTKVEAGMLLLEVGSSPNCAGPEPQAAFVPSDCSPGKTEEAEI